jgi:hypothetical protein
LGQTLLQHEGFRGGNGLPDVLPCRAQIQKTKNMTFNVENRAYSIEKKRLIQSPLFLIFTPV